MTQNKIEIKYNPISGHVFYIDADKVEHDITRNAVVLQDVQELKRIQNPKINSVYLVKSNGNIYMINKQNEWVKITKHDELLNVISYLGDLTPSVLTDEEGNMLAPATTINNVYSERGFNIPDFVNDERYLRQLRTHDDFVETTIEGQRVIPIPFPMENYDLERNYMGVIINNRTISKSKYIVNGNDLVFLNNSEYVNLPKGTRILFTFFYMVIHDLNNNVKLNTNNYADFSITTNKLSRNISIPARNIVMSDERQFLTIEERNKLRHLSPLNYVHPSTHSASMIVETKDKKFVTPEEKNLWNKKANAEDVFTKEETTAHVLHLLNTEDLEKFLKIAEALGNDPDFSHTILTKLMEKVENTEFEKLKAVVDKKTYKNDFVANTVYDLANKYTSDNIDYYSISLPEEETFREYIDGMSVTIKIAETNMNKCRLRINNLDFKPILNPEQFELIKGELKKESIYQLRYNGTTGNFILQGKGGVKITDAALMKRKVGKDGNVDRGNPVDIDPDGTINRSRPRIEPLSRFDTNIEGVSPSNVYADIVDMKHVFISWINANKLYGVTYPINKHNISNPSDNHYLIIENEATNSDIIKINQDTYISVASNNATINMKVLKMVDGKINLEDVTGETILSTGIVRKIHLIGFDNNKFILTYSHSNITETLYYKYIPSSNSLEKISTRNNTDYPIDEFQKINNNQILFVGNYLNSIIGWVMNVDETDFNNSTTKRLAITNQPSKTYTNVKLFAFVNNRALLNYELEDVKLKKIVSIEGNGEISTNAETSYSYDTLDMKHHSIDKRRYMSNIDSYISASNYDKEIEVLNGNSKCIKLMIEREGNNGLFYTLDKVSHFLYDDRLIAYDINIYLEYGILAYFGNNSKLKIVLFQIRRKPNGISIANGKPNEECKFYKF